MRRDVLQRLGSGLVALLVMFSCMTLRSLRRGEVEMVASDQAFNAGELERSVRHARRAAALYVPGAAHVDAAYARLRAVALGAERARDPQLAASAWRAVRAAALETRHLWLPRAEELARADLHLARLGGALSPRATSVSSSAGGSGPAVAVLLALGLTGAAGSLVWLLQRSLVTTGGWLPGRARWPALGLAASVVAMSWALLHA